MTGVYITGYSICGRMEFIAFPLLLFACVSCVCGKSVKNLTDEFYGDFYGQPEQIHLAYGETPDEMTVTWTTFSPTTVSTVQYGVGNDLTMMMTGSMSNFTDGGTEKRVYYTHRVTLTGLTPGQRYVYRAGSSQGWSELFSFQAMKAGQDWLPRFLVYGDLGNYNAQSLPRIQTETMKGMYDLVLHVGDLAYNLDTKNGRVGDAFMNQIQPVAAFLPYMVCPGNHEAMQNFSHIKHRFSMPKAGGAGENLWYSFNVGPVHVISVSSEVYYSVQYGWEMIVEQYKWVENDLKEANLPENRKKRPWIIAMAHKPMYCSNSDNAAICTNIYAMVRTGTPWSHQFGLEDLFYNYGVDLQFYGHEHSYERLWPVYNRTVCNGSYEQPYVNPTGPVHIITGSAGCGGQKHDPFLPSPLPWTAFRIHDYGYLRLNILNSTHLYMEQVSDDKGGQVIDHMTLVREQHGPGSYTCHLKNKRSAESNDV